MEVKYGLPLEVRYCKRCVISNQRPNSVAETRNVAGMAKATIAFNADGVCDACLVAQRKRGIDWGGREAELIDLCGRFKRDDGGYDCLVPGSGGKDSFYAAHVLKYKYGMRPLTVTWAPHLYTDWGRRNHQRWIDAGFDNYLLTPNTLVHRLLTRLAVDNLFHPFQPFMLGQKCLAPKMARLFGIPLVFYGENEAEYGNPVADTGSALRSAEYYTRSEGEIYFSGVPVEELKGRYGLTGQDLIPYMPMREADGIEVHYLGYYLKWHPQSCYYYSFEHGGFEPSPVRTVGTYSKYNSIDDKIDDFHYHTTGIKYGIGRASYDAAQEVRSGDIEREEAVLLVHKYDHEYPERFSKEVFEYLSVPGMGEFTRGYYDGLCDKFRSEHLWVKDGGKWRLRYPLV